ncbi:hypothetical protein ABMA58_08320 [Oceanospirillum sp. HFRX-1_2]
MKISTETTSIINSLDDLVNWLDYPLIRMPQQSALTITPSGV